MEISFVLSADELFTLMSASPECTKAGRNFSDQALIGAKICDLSGLVDKKLARRAEDELALSPVMRMLTDTLTGAESAVPCDNGWEIRSPWITVRCEIYPYREGHFRIIPMKEGCL